LPEVATIQIEDSYPVRFSSVTTRVNRVRAPSGEICGSAIHTKLNKSFSVIARFAPAAVEVVSRAASEPEFARIQIPDTMTNKILQRKVAKKRTFIGTFVISNNCGERDYNARFFLLFRFLLFVFSL